MKRENRHFSLTPAGEHFYRQSLLFMADFDRLCKETKQIAQGDDFVLRVGYTKGYGGLEEARLMVVSGKGFLPIEGGEAPAQFAETIAHLPLCRNCSTVLSCLQTLYIRR